MLLTDAQRRPRREFGETLPASTRLVLQHLGVEQAFDAQSHEPCHLRTSTWGSAEQGEHSSLFDAYGPSYFLQRDAFDDMLRQEASKRGVTLRVGAKLHGPATPDEGALSLEEDGRRTTVTASYIVDATGRSAALARHFGTTQVRADDLCCVVARLAPAALTQPLGTHVETAPHGWWYRAASAARGTTLLLFTDTELVRSLGLTEPARWAAVFSETSLAKAAPSNWEAELQMPLECRSARCRRLAPVATEQWAAVGDAATTFDPLSSRGITAALMSGMHAAAAFVAHRRGERDAVARYAQVMERVFTEHLAQRRAYYAMEQRWATTPFWHARIGEPEASPGSPPLSAR